MKLSEQVLTLLLCFSLLRFTAQAESFGPTSQSNEQQPPPPVQQSPQELQQLVAPIALYRDARMMTFIVEKFGTIYEKDLGRDTTKLAQTMTSYDPDSTWPKVE